MHCRRNTGYRVTVNLDESKTLERPIRDSYSNPSKRQHRIKLGWWRKVREKVDESTGCGKKKCQILVTDSIWRVKGRKLTKVIPLSGLSNGGSIA